MPPEAILKFNLPDDNQEFKFAVKGKNLYSAIINLDNSLRTYCKHGHHFKDADETVNRIREELHEHLSDSDVNLSEFDC